MKLIAIGIILFLWYTGIADLILSILFGKDDD